jgi:hypothetical protein
MKTRAYDGKYLTKILHYLTEDAWNYFDIITFLTFYLAMGIRFSPIFGTIFYIDSESSYEIARVLYCLSLTFYYFRTLGMVSCLSFCGPKIIMIKV